MGTWIRLAAGHEIIEWDGQLYLIDGQGYVLLSDNRLVMRVGKRRFVRIVASGVNSKEYRPDRS